MSKRLLTAITIVALLTSVAHAQPTVDGTRDASYGPPIAIQTVQTAFFFMLFLPPTAAAIFLASSAL